MQLAAVIACGGASTRMGRDKATLEIAGERLLDRVARRLAIVADPVLIAPGQPGRLGPLPWPQVADEVADGGPAAGVVAALSVSPHPLVAAVAVDLPFVDPELLRELAAAWAGEAVVVPVAAGHHQWLHAVWSTDAHAELRRRLRSGARSFAALVDGLAVRAVDPGRDHFAVNLNTPADLAGLEGADSVDGDGVWDVSHRQTGG